MPLPTVKENLYFVDKSGDVRTDVQIKVKDSGYKPNAEYYPTMRACRCLSCGAVGCLGFHNGFNLKLGDRVMNGKPIPGYCPRCAKYTELIPLPVDDPKTKEVRLYYQMQEALNEGLRRGQHLTGTSIVWPLARIKAWEKHLADSRQQQLTDSAG